MFSLSKLKNLIAENEIVYTINHTSAIHAVCKERREFQSHSLCCLCILYGHELCEKVWLMRCFVLQQKFFSIEYNKMFLNYMRYVLVFAAPILKCFRRPCNIAINLYLSPPLKRFFLSICSKTLSVFSLFWKCRHYFIVTWPHNVPQTSFEKEHKCCSHMYGWRN